MRGAARHTPAAAGIDESGKRVRQYSKASAEPMVRSMLQCEREALAN